MSAKSNKELETQNSELTKRLDNLQINFEKRSEEHKILQGKLLETERRILHCNNCEKSPGIKTAVKKHRTNHETTKTVFKCNQCEREFNEEWMMSARVKAHKKYTCETCDTTFKN